MYTIPPYAGTDIWLWSSIDDSATFQVQAHSNASEYMPILLLMMGLLEAGGSTSAWLLHLYGKMPDPTSDDSRAVSCLVISSMHAPAYAILAQCLPVGLYPCVPLFCDINWSISKAMQPLCVQAEIMCKL